MLEGSSLPGQFSQRALIMISKAAAKSHNLTTLHASQQCNTNINHNSQTTAPKTQTFIEPVASTV
jgi:hypothetical protein